MWTSWSISSCRSWKPSAGSKRCSWSRVAASYRAEAIDIQHLLTAAVDFPQTEAAGLLAWPHFLQFPDSELLTGRRTLIVDDVWGSGRTSTAVRARVEGAGAEAFTCVFHFNPFRSLYSQAQPDFYGARTDAYIVYPWESDRDLRRIGLYDPQSS